MESLERFDFFQGVFPRFVHIVLMLVIIRKRVVDLGKSEVRERNDYVLGRHSHYFIANGYIQDAYTSGRNDRFSIPYFFICADIGMPDFLNCGSHENLPPNEDAIQASNAAKMIKYCTESISKNK